MNTRRYASHHIAVLLALSILCIATIGCSDSHDAAMPDNQIHVWLTLGDESKKLHEERDLTWQNGASAGSERITVDGATRFQTMEGFGAAMTDSSAWLIMTTLDENQRRTLMRDLFTREGDGIGLSYVRIPMGASDFALESYTYNDLPAGETDPDQLYFSIAHDEAYIIPALQLARDLNPQLRFMGSPWSPPAWMKSTDSLNGGLLLPQFLQSLADYHVKFVQAYAEANLPIDAITPQNEPLHMSLAYPTMLMLPSQQQALLRDHLGPTFRAAGLTTRIVIFDHNWDLSNYPLQVLADPAAAAFADGIAFHCYGGDVAAQSLLHNAHPDKGIWFTECSGGRWAPEFAGSVSWNMHNLVMGNFRNWGNSLLLWNLALDENDGPQNGGCTNCRGVVTIDQTTRAVTYNLEYYVLGHVSKFVEPGAYRIASTPGGAAIPDNVAFLNPDGSMVLIVQADTATTFAVDWNGQHFSYSLPSQGTVTFTWSAGSPEL